MFGEQVGFLGIDKGILEGSVGLVKREGLLGLGASPNGQFVGFVLPLRAGRHIADKGQWAVLRPAGEGKNGRTWDEHSGR